MSANRVPSGPNTGNGNGPSRRECLPAVAADPGVRGRTAGTNEAVTTATPAAWHRSTASSQAKVRVQRSLNTHT
ncbi:hypothetical protein Ais01nite_72970 [Asanoa ishikariensis]|nr:hypothetical protein Ais01nite_72970 [Asanoa ishikariensis]